MQINSYQDLTVWQKAMDLATVCYDLTRIKIKGDRLL